MFAAMYDAKLGSESEFQSVWKGQRGSFGVRIFGDFSNYHLQLIVFFFICHQQLFGDGFAIWYARDRLVTGPVFGSKDHFMGLAIILDTYSNHNGPHNVRNAKSIRFVQRVGVENLWKKKK